MAGRIPANWRFTRVTCKKWAAQKSNFLSERGGLSGLRTLCSGGEWRGREWCAGPQGEGGRKEMVMSILKGIRDKCAGVGLANESDG
jgi:hypothetical protein